MNQKSILTTACISGASAVMIGAFGAHALRDTLVANGRLDTFELAVRYQFYHTLALLAVGILAERFQKLGIAAMFFLIGIIIFSGSLFILSLTGVTTWGMVTPFGGLAFIIGWLLFLRGVLSSSKS